MRDRQLLRFAGLLAQIGRLDVGLLQQEVADRQCLAVDRRRARRADRQVDDVLDVRVRDLHRLVVDLDLDAADGLRVGVVAEDLQPAQLGDELLDRTAQRVALTGQQHVDDAEDVLVLHGRQEGQAGVLRGVRTARRTVAGEPADGEHTGTDEGDGADDGGDDRATGAAEGASARAAPSVCRPAEVVAVAASRRSVVVPRFRRRSRSTPHSATLRGREPQPSDDPVVATRAVPSAACASQSPVPTV